MKPVFCIAIFLAVVFVGDRLVSVAAKAIIQHSRNQFVRMYAGRQPADIVFLGNSRVDRNLNFETIHEMTGKACLNLGLGGNHVLISEVLLKDYVQRYGNPELVVIELSHSTVRTDSMGEMGIFAFCSTNMEALARSIDPTYAEFARVFQSLRFNSPAFWRLAAEALAQPSSRLLKNTIPPEIVKQWENGAHAELPVLEKNVEALKRICNYADARKIPLRLLIAPYWKQFKVGTVNFESWKATIQQATSPHHIDDYSEVFFNQPDYFNDEMHLNSVGAACFSKKLVVDKVL